MTTLWLNFLAAPVEGKLAEPHGAHEGKVGELVIKELLTLRDPQTSQLLRTGQTVRRTRLRLTSRQTSGLKETRL
jgi:hypothetical protein